MKVLMISGDKNFKPGNPRYDLQRSAVEELDVFVWPRADSLWRIFSAARRNRYDVVTAQDPFWRGHLAHHLVQLFGGKLNIQVHTDLSAYPPLKRFFARFQLRNADSIRVVSEKIKQQVLAMGAKGRITILPVFVDVPKFASVVRKPHSSKNILWMGRFEEEKNPLEAISVLKTVLQTVPNAKLIMVGDGSWGQRLSDAAAHFPIQTVDISVGWQNPLVYLDTADVVLCTSWHESWGASIIEALAAGVPVVAPDVGIAKEAGAIVVPHEKLAEAVIKVLQTGQRGELKLHLPDAQEWVQRWKKSL